MKNFYKKDGISRVYAEGGKKRFMQWFNSETMELENVPEVALCDEIFLNDEHDVEFSNSVYEQYLQNITEIEKGLVDLRLKKDVAKLSIVGAGMMSNPGVAAKMFECLYNNNININMISTSEIKVSVLIDEKFADAAVIAVHDKFVN